MTRESEVQETVSAFAELESSEQADFLSALLRDIALLNNDIEAGRAVLEASRNAGEEPRAEDINTVIEKERRLALLEVSFRVVCEARSHQSALCRP